MPLDLETSQDLKEAGFPQDFDLTRPCWYWINGRLCHVISVRRDFIECCDGSRYDLLTDDRCAAPEEIDVLESEWLETRGVEWDRHKESSEWVAWWTLPDKSDYVRLDAANAPELIRRVLARMEEHREQSTN